MSTNTRVIAALVFTTLTLSGCAFVADQPGTRDTPSPTPSATPPRTLTDAELLAWKQMAANNPDSLGPGEGEVEYAEARRSFPLTMPRGMTIPETTSFDFYPAGGLYGRGLGYGLVSWTWLCATETDLLRAIGSGDDEGAEELFAQLDAWMALPSDVRMLEGVDAFRSVVVDPARAGDTAGLEADKQSWCAQAPFEAD